MRPIKKCYIHHILLMYSIVENNQWSGSSSQAVIDTTVCFDAFWNVQSNYYINSRHFFKFVSVMEELNELDFAYTFRPIYYFSRIFGLMPFTITYYPNGQVKGTRIGLIDGVWLCIAIIAYFSSAYNTYQMMKIVVVPDSPILFNLSFTIQISRLFSGGVIVWLDFCNRFRYVNILKKLSTFDRTVSSSYE